MIALIGYIQAMASPDSAVVTEPHWRRRETVPLVVGSQVREVASPAVKT